MSFGIYTSRVNDINYLTFNDLLLSETIINV